MKAPLKGLTPEQQQQIERVVDYIVNTVYGDLEEALGAFGKRLDNESLMETVADHLHDYPQLYHYSSGPELDPETHKAWLAADWAARRKWLVREFPYA